jgi:GNAT superfamily N-acetyltransferase
MRIERACSGDRSQIAHLDDLAFGSECEPLRWTDTFWVARDMDRVVAFASARIVPGDVVFLSRCAVLPCARGQGLQRRFIRARVRLARLPAVTYTMPGNVSSANNLIACGFRLYRPTRQWAGDALYWARRVQS